MKYKIYFEQVCSGTAEIEAGSPEKADNILLGLKKDPGLGMPNVNIDTDSYRFDSDHIIRKTLETYEIGIGGKEYKCVRSTDHPDYDPEVDKT